RKYPIKTIFYNLTAKIEDNSKYLGKYLEIISDFQPDIIQIFGTEAEKQRRGTLIGEVRGIVNEWFGVTRIGNLDQGAIVTALLIVDSIQVEPTLISTSDIGSSSGGSLPAESYEGVLVKIDNVIVIDDNADGNSGPDEGSGGNRNFGEILIADESNVQMRLEMQDGTHDFHNLWSSELEETGTRVETGHTFESITGILYYSFGNYKLVPRKNSDFVGHVTSVNVNEFLPKEYTLNQNYPNPFNPSTIIKYTIPNLKSSLNSNVVLKVYDILGREVQTLVNEVQRPGTYEIQFDASSVEGQISSGIYFYSLTAGEFFQTKKMILLK
ncbi:MAG: T9SS type A sorting domain-containing protein, partial [Melioribacteraceae bacterium]|nr:T9SS type A sorting domain-containing protein [Melioribacteraceae bacterium]